MHSDNNCLGKKKCMLHGISKQERQVGFFFFNFILGDRETLSPNGEIPLMPLKILRQGSAVGY